MQYKLVIREGKWYTLDDKKVPAKFFKVATLLSQKTTKGQIVFTYEATEEGQNLLDKAKIAKPKKETKAKRGRKKKVEQKEDEDLFKDNQYSKTNALVIKDRKVNFFDGGSIAKGESKVVLARGNTRTKKQEPEKAQKIRCSFCNRDVLVQPWEIRMRSKAEDMLYRCNKCCGA